MTGLAALLAGDLPPGAYRWDAAYDADAVRQVVEAVGRRLAHLDAGPEAGRAGTLEALGRALDLPAWWGRNLDALTDCLRDAEPGTVLLWDGWGALATDDPRTFGVVLRLLGGAGLVVLLHGPGPATDLPSLD